VHDALSEIGPHPDEGPWDTFRQRRRFAGKGFDESDPGEMFDVLDSVGKELGGEGPTVRALSGGHLETSVASAWISVYEWMAAVMIDGAETAESVDRDPTAPVSPVAVTVDTTLRRMVQIWPGDVTWARALRAGDVRLNGARTLCRAARGSGCPHSPPSRGPGSISARVPSPRGADARVR
jgi:hypothetical protein